MKRYIFLVIAAIILMADIYSFKTGHVFFRYGSVYTDKSPGVFYYSIFISLIFIGLCIFQFSKNKN